MKPRLHIVTTVPLSLAVLLRGQPAFLRRSFDVTLVCASGPAVSDIAAREGVPVVTVPLSRKITPAVDAVALAKLTRMFRRSRPDIVQTYTPKAGLIGMLAARAARVPVRVHGIVGMPLMEASGLKKRLLATTERLTYSSATHLTANSTGLRDWIHGHLTGRSIAVLGHGSINGIDTSQFADVWSAEDKARLRVSLGIPADARIFAFVGRLVRDKGIGELVDAFSALHRDHPTTRLMLIGDPEPELQALRGDTTRVLESHPAIVRTGFVDDVRPYLAIADTFVLPSYREGLPNSLLEAGAMGLPSITTDINGCNEVVLDGDNGLVVPPKDAAALERAMRSVLDRPERHSAMRARSRPSVLERYDQQRFWPVLERYYLDLASTRRR